jgi:hypothetical protein
MALGAAILSVELSQAAPMIVTGWKSPPTATLLLVVLTSCGGNSGSSMRVIMPQITTQPSSQTVTSGQTGTFSVVATGTAPLAYQWKKNGTAIAGATASVYTTPATTIADSGSTFAVTVSNAVGSAPSGMATLTVKPAQLGTDVVTYKYDVMRTGQNLTETTLTPSNVSSPTFGLLRNLVVDGLVDSQPLYLSGLTVLGASHNVVFVATENDSVYAFDSDTGASLWQVSLLGAGETASDDRGCDQVTPQIGVTSTPVIDRSAGAHGMMFVVAMSKDASSNYHQRLHALDVTTGAELLGGPTEIVATDVATTFDPAQYKERAALLLVNGTIYTSFASHCDNGPYGGWVIAYSESTIAFTSALNLALEASGSGYASQGPSIWMSGGGPAADSAGNVYVLTANGKFDSLNSMGFPSLGDYGNSFVKMALSGGSLGVTDYFAMDDEVSESSSDTDLGSGGIMLLPDFSDSTGTTRHLAVGAGKDSNLYVVDRDHMGGFSASSNAIWQELDGVLPNGIWSTPAYFNATVYYCPQGGPLMAFPISQAMLAAAPASQTSAPFTYPGTFPVVSANGATNGIVWAYENTSPAVLHAFSAANLGTELYNSNQAAGGRDHFGSGNKFIVPVVADGKVFAASSNSVAVFGILP